MMRTSNSAIFDGISQDEFDRMMTCFGAYTQSFKSGDVICDFSQGANKIGILLEGSVFVYRTNSNGNTSVMERLWKDGVFGQALAFSSKSGDFVQVVCEKNCTILFMDYDRIAKQCANACPHHTTLVRNMFRLLSDKTYQLSERIDILCCRSIREKLMSYFRMKAARVNSNSFDLDCPIVAVANYISADRSATTRELKKMQEDGLIKMKHRHVDLLDP